MSKRRDSILLEDILESLDKINRYTENINKEQFEKDDMIMDAVVRNLEIIGEATNRLSEELKNQYTDVNWVQIKGLRNRIVHEYFGISNNIIWEIVKKDIPVLKIHLLMILNQPK